MREIYLGMPFCVVGFKETTNNKTETKSGGVIPKLWDKFHQSELFKADNIKFSVYFNYQNQHLLDYDVLVGATGWNKNFLNSSVDIKTGRYIVFETSGEIYKAVPLLWGEIWDFFEKTDIKRAYTTDFEKYVSYDKVEIYISIL